MRRRTTRSVSCNFLGLASIFQLQTPTQTTEQRRAQPVVVVHPLNSNQRVISNGIAQRGTTGRVTANQNMEPQSVRGAQATVRSIPGERLIGVTLSQLLTTRSPSFPLVSVGLVC